jgi:NAD(P)H-hydrate epimerase
LNDLTWIADVPTLHRRARSAHKGDFGRVLVVGGCPGMAGAPALAGLAALRGGAGLVTVACPNSIAHTVAGFEPSYMTAALPSDSDGRIQGDGGADAILKLPFDVLAMGPGLSQSESLANLVRRVYLECVRPLVMDADALNLLARFGDALPPRNAPTILTPHPGEFARLSGRSAVEIAARRVEEAAEFARRRRVVLVLKGAGTVVTDGVRCAVNRTGNPGMATGGSGDVLTGLVAALVGQGLEAWSAARLAVHVHGLAGDLSAQDNSEISLIARDLVDALPAAFRRLEPAD